MGRSAVVGASALQIDYARQELRSREHVVRSGEVVTIDGSSGEVLLGAVPLRAAHLADNPDYTRVLGWADERAAVRVLAEADTAAQAQLCRDLGLSGIGLSRSERLLCSSEHSRALREVCARPGDEAARGRLTAALLPSYRQLLLAAPAGELMLRLLDPVAATALLAAADCELQKAERALVAAALAGNGGDEGRAMAGERLRAVWLAQLMAIADAGSAPVPCRPLALIPAEVAPAELDVWRWARSASGLALGALVPGPIASAPYLASLLASLQSSLAYLDVIGFTDGEPSAAVVQGVRAAAGSRPIRLGLYGPPAGESGDSESTVAAAAHLGLDFVVCPPLRAPIARLYAAQVRLRAAS
jgi:pyruvate,orthophosphate dikinase